jgi:hypothetical protein
VLISGDIAANLPEKRVEGRASGWFDPGYDGQCV